MGMVSVHPSTYSEVFTCLPFTDGELHLLSFSPSCNHCIHFFSHGCHFSARPTSYFVLKKVYKSWLNITGYIPLKLGENVKLEYTLSHKKCLPLLLYVFQDALQGADTCASAQTNQHIGTEFLGC